MVTGAVVSMPIAPPWVAILFLISTLSIVPSPECQIWIAPPPEVYPGVPSPVALLLESNVEYLIFDFQILHASPVVVPRYNSDGTLKCLD